MPHTFSERCLFGGLSQHFLGRWRGLSEVGPCWPMGGIHRATTGATGGTAIGTTSGIGRLLLLSGAG